VTVETPLQTPPPVQIGSRLVGDDYPTYLIAEIGINHNGDIQKALELMKVAHDAGCDAVKFQKRDPEICVPPEQREVMRETPWGLMTYLAYKQQTEFWEEEYRAVNDYAKKLGIDWFASPWDIPSVEFLEQFDPICYKIASACITDHELLRVIARTGRPVILSTGMSTLDEIRNAVTQLRDVPLLIAHSTSTYPCPPTELNLRMIPELKREFATPVGYSGHEIGLQTTIAAVVLGATFVERHITLDRAMWGSDHAASIEPQGLNRLVRDIRVIESALGDGVKRVYESEVPVRAKLRRVP
jgi:N-acetylneuraminate synthase